MIRAYLLLSLPLMMVFPELIQAQGIEAQADQATRLISKYGWPAMAFIGSPYLSWRLTQWYKLANKKLYDRKPHWLLMDLGSSAMVFGLTYWAWSLHADNALFISFIVACMHTGIVKAIFAYAPKTVTDILQHGVYVNGDKTQYLTATVMGYGGQCRRSHERKAVDELEQTVVLTDAERAEITNPKQHG